MHRRHLAERHALLAVLLLVTASASPSLAIMPLRPDLREAAAKAGSASGPHFPTLLAPAAPGEVRTTGEIRALVLMIDFADSPAGAGHPASFFQNLLFAEQGKSLTTYYRENSYGQLHVTGEVTGWLRSNRSYRNDYVNRDGIPGTADDYGFDTSPRAFDPRVDPYPKNVWGLVMEAASLADPAVDFSQYDGNGDGKVDALIVIHSGPGAEEVGIGDNSDYIWSHHSDVAEYLSSIGQPPFLVDGVEIAGYVMVSESGRLGIACHEFGHRLGLPDLYRTVASTGEQQSVVGDFDIMDSGGWLPNNTASNPASFSAWSKYQLGWIDPIAIELAPGASARIDDARIVPAAATPTPGGNETAFFRILANAGGRDWSVRSPGTGQYFLIENRVPGLGDYDDALPASGLAIWRVDETRSDNNSVAEGEHLLTLVQADGEDYRSMVRDRLGEPTDLWPGSRQVARFAHDTSPSSDLPGGVFSGAEVDSIRRAGLSIRASLSAAALRIGPAYAYPNPLVMDGENGEVSFVFRPSEGGDAAKSGPEPVRVRVYDLAGTLVATISSSDSPAVWNCRNDRGQMVAPGTYFYIIESQGETADGRVAIVH